jgi:AraC-like DNA-binding protein
MPKSLTDLALRARSLEQAQAFTSRVWGKHESTVPVAADFASDISRIPLGGSHFCTVDCASLIEVAVDGCSMRSFLYLPLEGNMEIRVHGETLRAVPGGPVLVPAKLAYEFSATPIKCIVLELRAQRLRSELDAMGCNGGKMPPLAWGADDADARALTALVQFANIELAAERKLPLSPVHLRRIESLMISCLARMLVGRLGNPSATNHRIGRRSPEEIAEWLERRVRQQINLSELASFAGLSLRSLQRRFLQHFHSSPAAYLRELRLDAAHAELSRPNCRMNVTEVAMAFLFEHLGRFAAVYRRKFGEPPSETLSRRKSDKG